MRQKGGPPIYTMSQGKARHTVAGDSVGGNIAAAVTLLAKERGGPPIVFQLLFYPVTNASFDTPSYMEYQEGYWLTRGYEVVLG